MRHRLALLAAAIAALFLASPVLADTGGPRYYLSVGDSLAAGTQPGALFTTDGYADQLHALEAGGFSDLRLVKLGCPGETTATLINGGICTYDEDGKRSQLDQAVQFLHAHRNHMAFVTIDIGANDLLACQPAFAAVCVGPALAAASANLATILAALEAADPDVTIVGMNYYNPLLVLWFVDPAIAAAFNGLVTGLFNPTLEATYAAGGVPVADVESAFQTTNFTLVGGIPTNVALICAWTWMCSVADIHTNATGYGVIAATFAPLVP